jgi:hypothetical protein
MVSPCIPQGARTPAGARADGRRGVGMREPWVRTTLPPDCRAPTLIRGRFTGGRPAFINAKGQSV